VLGSSCSIPRPGRACSSYLVEFPGVAVVADLGSGAFANLIRHRTLEELDAVLISHMHSDHFIDVLTLRYALKYGDARRTKKLPLYLPPGGEVLLRAMAAAFHPESDGDFLGDVFDVLTYEPERRLQIGAASVRFAQTAHYISTFAMRFEASGRSIAYSSDSAPDDRVRALAAGADLFVCEATLSRAGEDERPRGHMSAREAAALAASAEAGRLVLSHYPASLDLAAMERDARQAFAGPLTIADDGLSLAL
jgi:ribonuclease BN (tRNA processing enzyme)